MIAILATLAMVTLLADGDPPNLWTGLSLILNIIVPTVFGFLRDRDKTRMKSIEDDNARIKESHAKCTAENDALKKKCEDLTTDRAELKGQMKSAEEDRDNLRAELAQVKKDLRDMLSHPPKI